MSLIHDLQKAYDVLEGRSDADVFLPFMETRGHIKYPLKNHPNLCIQVRKARDLPLRTSSLSGVLTWEQCQEFAFHAYTEIDGRSRYWDLGFDITGVNRSVVLKHRKWRGIWFYNLYYDLVSFTWGEIP